MTTAMTRTVGTETLPAVGVWSLDPSHTNVGFSVRHLGLSKVRGRFSSFTGDLVVADEPSESSVHVSIDVTSVDTRDEKRDEHLRTNDFFAAQEFPTMSFASTGLTGGAGAWQVTGDLTIKGVTKPVVLDVTFEGTAADPWGGSRAAFSATTEIDREDFGMTWNAALEAGGVLVGKRVKIEIEAEAVLQQPTDA